MLELTEQGFYEIRGDANQPTPLWRPTSIQPRLT